MFILYMYVLCYHYVVNKDEYKLQIFISPYNGRQRLIKLIYTTLFAKRKQYKNNFLLCDNINSQTRICKMSWQPILFCFVQINFFI